MSCCSGQEISYGPGFHTALINNPGFSGAEGNGMLRMSYLNYFPGNQYNLHSFFTSFDSYFPQLHGGGAIWVSDDYLGGIVNDLHGGLSYAYFFQTGKDLYIHAGLSASFYHRGFDFSKAILPDQIDPFGGAVLPSSENLAGRGRSVIDIGAGFLFVFRQIYGGISLNHLTKPDISPEGFDNEELRPQFVMNLAGRMAGRTGKLEMILSAYLGIQGGFFEGGAGTTFSTELVSFTMMFLGNNSGNMNIQPGFSFHTGHLGLLYNYRFNVISNNSMMPVSLLHQVGLTFSLYDVDKRNDAAIVSFPKM